MSVRACLPSCFDDSRPGRFVFADHFFKLITSADHFFKLTTSADH